MKFSDLLPWNFIARWNSRVRDGIRALEKAKQDEALLSHTLALLDAELAEMRTISEMHRIQLMDDIIGFTQKSSVPLAGNDPKRPYLLEPSIHIDPKTGIITRKERSFNVGEEIKEILEQRKIYYEKGRQIVHELNSPAKELTNDEKAMLEGFNEQIYEALNQIDESRKEIEASSARTRAVREETNKLLASIGG